MISKGWKNFRSTIPVHPFRGFPDAMNPSEDDPRHGASVLPPACNAPNPVLASERNEGRCAMPELEIGIVTHYFGHINVAAIQITGGELAVGDTIHVKGHTADFTCTVDSMQLEHSTVTKAKKGDSVGLKVPDKAHEHYKVYKVIP